MEPNQQNKQVRKYQTDSDQSGEDNGERRGRVKSRNMYKGPMDKDNGQGRIECGRWGWLGKGRVIGKNGDNCN